MIDGRHWLHAANWWIQQQGRADLAVHFPDPVQVLTVAVDGVELTPIKTSSRQLRLPLSGAGTVRHVQLCWRYEPASETLRRPQLAPPLVAGASVGALVWTVQVPAGRALTNRSAAVPLKPGRLGAAQLALDRAAVQEQILSTLAERSGEPATEAPRQAALRRLELYCQAAERDLDLAQTGAGKGPDGQDLANRLAQLRKKFPLEAVGPESAAPPPGVVSASFSQIMTGTPYYAASTSVTDVPEAVLVSVQSQQTRQALLASGEWLGVLVGLWLLSLMPFVPTLVRSLWPEQLAATALAAWYVGMGPLAAAVVLGVALAARMVLLAHWLRR